MSDSEKDSKKIPKKIEIINGDGKNLDISPVNYHIKDTKPNPAEKKPKNIVIPKDKKED